MGKAPGCAWRPNQRAMAVCWIWSEHPLTAEAQEEHGDPEGPEGLPQRHEQPRPGETGQTATSGASREEAGHRVGEASAPEE